MGNLLERVKSNLVLKFLMTGYIIIVGFGYFFASINWSIKIWNNDSSDYWIILIWILYFVLLTIPSYYSWGFIKKVFPNLTLISKWIIMFIAVLIPIIYPSTALINLWLTRNQVKLAKKKKEKEEIKKQKVEIKKQKNIEKSDLDSK